MRKALMLAAAGALVLSACSQAEKTAESSNDAAVAAADAVQTSAEAARVPGDAAAESDVGLAPPPVVAAPPAPVARIAYAFRYVLSLPRDRGAEMMSRHELACLSAGPGYCQVISSQADWTARTPGGTLELRGQPDWINRFRSGLASDASNAGGRLDAAETNGEDVTRGIDSASTGVKTTASLAARIHELQARRGGTLAQRLEIERQLADLRQQQDAQAVELRALNDRVQSARLTIDYRQGGVFAADSPTRPVAQALHDAFGISMGVLGFLITLGSVGLPIAGIGAVIWWAAIRRRRKPATAA